MWSSVPVKEIIRECREYLDVIRKGIDGAKSSFKQEYLFLTKMEKENIMVYGPQTKEVF